MAATRARPQSRQTFRVYDAAGPAISISGWWSTTVVLCRVAAGDEAFVSAGRAVLRLAGDDLARPAMNLRAQTVTVRYGHRVAVDAVTLNVAPGEVLAILGA